MLTKFGPITKGYHVFELYLRCVDDTQSQSFAINLMVNLDCSNTISWSLRAFLHTVCYIYVNCQTRPTLHFKPPQSKAGTKKTHTLNALFYSNSLFRLVHARTQARSHVHRWHKYDYIYIYMNVDRGFRWFHRLSWFFACFSDYNTSLGYKKSLHGHKHSHT